VSEWLGAFEEQPPFAVLFGSLVIIILCCDCDGIYPQGFSGVAIGSV
jgi:hypothetical protein